MIFSLTCCQIVDFLEAKQGSKGPDWSEIFSFLDLVLIQLVPVRGSLMLRTNALKNANKIFWSAFWVVLMIIIAQANATVNQLSVLIVCLFICTEYLTEKMRFSTI